MTVGWEVLKEDVPILTHPLFFQLVEQHAFVLMNMTEPGRMTLCMLYTFFLNKVQTILLSEMERIDKMPIFNETNIQKVIICLSVFNFLPIFAAE